MRYLGVDFGSPTPAVLWRWRLAKFRPAVAPVKMGALRVTVARGTPDPNQPQPSDLARFIAKTLAAKLLDEAGEHEAANRVWE
ncbi:MAG TPA: hypothetical protein VEJ63_03950 [Planctomycetota bacterium]|nr:hypothetical protein [Planctomycetota bacterium]